MALSHNVLLLTILLGGVWGHDSPTGVDRLQKDLRPASAAYGWGSTLKGKRSGVDRYLRHRSEDVRWDEEPQGLESLFYSPDRFQVVSSSLRVIPRKGGGAKRSKRETTVVDWRKPRRHQFVTTSRLGKYLEPDPLRYYPEDRPHVPAEPRRRGTGSARRIIYYASLPEIVRPPSPPPPPPGDWARPPRYEGYPSASENEVVTRVQSPLIDVSPPGRFAPRITIIDAEPPYLRYSRPPPFDPYYHRFYRGDLFYPPPEHYYRYYEGRPPPTPQRKIIIPPLPNSFTVIRKPLDVRPLDPLRDATTSTSTTSTEKPDTSSKPTTTTLNPVAKFERIYKY